MKRYKRNKIYTSDKDQNKIKEYHRFQLLF